MALTFDPASQLGAASQGITGLPVIIGLPSSVNPVPTFVIGVSTTERVRTSSAITGMPITDGDLVMKSARSPGTYNFKFILSATPNVSNQQTLQISKALQQISNVASAIFGGGPANLTGTPDNVVASQLLTLRNMKDGFQPIFALNLYMPLSVFSIGSPYLTSSWYITDFNFDKEEAEQGVIVDISLKELLSKTETANTNQTKLINLANQLLGPGVGSSIGGFV